MTIESAVADLTTATTNLLAAVNTSKATLDAEVALATTQANAAAGSATVATTKASESAGSAAQALAIYGSTAAMNTAVSTSTTNAATATTQAGIATTQATAAAASAASAAAIVTGVSSNRPSVRPSLLIDFAAMGKLDPRITFGRASSALAYDGKTTVKAEENLLTYSQTFASPWGYTALTVTTNSAVAPDGTTTAAKLASDATNDQHKTGYTSAAIAAGLPYTYSVFLKAAEYQWAYLRLDDSGTAFAGWFDLVNGVIGTLSSGITASISPVGSGWYRCSVTRTNASATTWYPAIGLANADNARIFTGASGFGVYAWGAQLEQRPYATAYTPTTTAAITNYIPALQSYAANVARFDFNPVTGESLGLMVEEQRTNLLTYSQYFNTSPWTPTNVNLLPNVALAPDGTLTATLLSATAVSGQHFVTQSQSTSGTTTFSVYAKAAGQNWLGLGGNGVSFSAFNLSTGVVSTQGTGVTATITAVGNGWYRCSVTQTYSTAVNYIFVENANSQAMWTGDGYTGILIWGAQSEQGAFATSYIPTLLTYSGRGSTGTYIGDNGLIQTAAANVARYQRNIAGAVQLLLEGTASNLVNWTSDFSQWAKNGGATGAYVIPNMAIAPDGTFSADMLLSGGADASIGQFPVLANGTYTFSVWLKAGSRSSISLYSTMNSTPASVACTLTSAWQRFSLTFVYNQTGSVLIGGGSTFTSGSIYAWGAQLETGSVATSYIPSTETFTSRSSTATYFDPSGVMRTAPAGLARYDFDPVTGLSKGLLVEAAASNLALYSEQFDAGTYYKSNATITANATAAPDGNTTADQLVEDTAGGVAHRAYQSVIPVVSGSNYTTSIYVKSSGRTQAMLQYFDGVTNAFAFFDLAALSVLSSTGAVSASIQALNNGWRRLVITATAGSTFAGIYINAATGGTQVYTGDGASGLYLWGFQIELGNVATSYIPTTTVAVTRAADSASSVANSRAADVWASAQATRSSELPTMTGANFSSWYRQDEGSFYFEASVLSIAAAQRYAASIESSSSNRMAFGDYGGAFGVATVTNGTLVSNLAPTGALVSNTPYKAAMSFKANDFTATKNGGTTAAGTSGALPVVNQLSIGHSQNASILNGYIKRIAYFPRRLTNSELQGLTS